MGCHMSKKRLASGGCGAIVYGWGGVTGTHIFGEAVLDRKVWIGFLYFCFGASFLAGVPDEYFTKVL